MSVSLALAIQLFCHAFMSCAYLLCLLSQTVPPPLSGALSPTEKPLRCIVQLKASALSLPRLSWTSGAISLYFYIHTYVRVCVYVCLYVSLFACLSFWLLAYLICAFKHFKQAAAAVDALSHLLPLPSHSLSLLLSSACSSLLPALHCRRHQQQRRLIANSL